MTPDSLYPLSSYSWTDKPEYNRSHSEMSKHRSEISFLSSQNKNKHTWIVKKKQQESCQNGDFFCLRTSNETLKINNKNKNWFQTPYWFQM